MHLEVYSLAILLVSCFLGVLNPLRLFLNNDVLSTPSISTFDFWTKILSISLQVILVVVVLLFHCMLVWFLLCWLCWFWYQFWCLQYTIRWGLQGSWFWLLPSFLEPRLWSSCSIVFFPFHTDLYLLSLFHSWYVLHFFFMLLFHSSPSSFGGKLGQILKYVLRLPFHIHLTSIYPICTEWCISCVCALYVLLCACLIHLEFLLVVVATRFSLAHRIPTFISCWVRVWKVPELWLSASNFTISCSWWNYSWSLVIFFFVVVVVASLHTCGYILNFRCCFSWEENHIVLVRLFEEVITL